jgi:hypothetical protein
VHTASLLSSNGFRVEAVEHEPFPSSGGCRLLLELETVLKVGCSLVIIVSELFTAFCKRYFWVFCML